MITQRQYFKSESKEHHGLVYRYCLFERCNFQSIDACIFHSCRFKDCTFDSTGIVKSTFLSCKFSQCNLYYTEFRHSTIGSCAFKDCKLTGTRFGCDTTMASCSGVKYAMASFTGYGVRNRVLLAIEIDGVAIYNCGCFRGTERGLIDWIYSDSGEYRDSRLKGLKIVKRMLS